MGISFLIREILKYNNFDFAHPLHHPNSTLCTDKKASQTGFYCSGVYRLASRLNHSCYPNAILTHIGDRIILRAARDIMGDEELTIAYLHPIGHYNPGRRKKGLKLHLSTCTCPICAHDRAISKEMWEQRAALRKDYDITRDNPADTIIPMLERIVADLERTYTEPAYKVPRIESWPKYLILCRYYAHLRHNVKTTQMLFEALRALGFLIEFSGPNHEPAGNSTTPTFKVFSWGIHVDQLLEIWVRLWTAFGKFELDSCCAEVERCARISWKIFGGLDHEFEEEVVSLVQKYIEED